MIEIRECPCRTDCEVLAVHDNRRFLGYLARQKNRTWLAYRPNGKGWIFSRRREAIAALGGKKRGK